MFVQGNKKMDSNIKIPNAECFISIEGIEEFFSQHTVFIVTDDFLI